MTDTTSIPTDLGSWIERRAAAGPNRTAITFEGKSTTYAQLLDRIDRLAAELSAGGIGNGDRVGYLGLNHPTFLEALFATTRLGAVFVPLNFRLTASELSFIIADAGVHTLIADAEHAAVVEPLREQSGLRRTITLDTLDGAAAWEPFEELIAARSPITEPQAPRDDDVAVIMYTSGTTGRPKGAMLTHGNFFWNNVNALMSFDVNGDDVSLVGAPLFHIGGLNVTTLLTLQKGGEIVLMRAFDPGQALKLIAERNVTTMFGVPAMFLFMSQVPEFAGTDLSSVRYFICGGAPVPEALIHTYSAREVPFAQGYGLTETTPLALVMRTDESASKIGAAGHHVLPLSDVRLVDAENRPVGHGERGEVCVRGPQVMRGYWNNQRATDAVIDSGGWFHTGDIGEMDSDGYVYIVDRVKDMVISGGENVYPAEVEAVLYEHPSVAEVAVLGLPHERWGEAVTAVAALREGATLSLDKLREFAKDRLAGYKIPLRLETVEALPRNPAGKILKYQLRDRLTP